MSIYGPASEQSSSQGNLDMGGNKITNLAKPVMASDAATMGYVSNYVSHLQNSKVNWSGGTMTGSLNMGGFKLTNVGAPEDPNHATTKGYVDNLDQYLNDRKVQKAGDTMTGDLNMLNNRITGIGTPVDDNDCVNKMYVDSKVHDLDVNVKGTYVIISKNGHNMYFSVRPKRNIDLDSGKLVEIKNNSVESTDRHITTAVAVNLLPNDGKDLQIMELSSEMKISFRPPHYLATPWTFLVSLKRGDSPPKANNQSVIECYDLINQTLHYIFFKWTTTSFEYAITDMIMTPENTITIDLDTSQFYHIAFEHVGNKLILWLNGISRKTHNNITLGGVSDFKIGAKQVGIVSLYNRELNKGEIIEHFVENHVKNFTDDVVLI